MGAVSAAQAHKLDQALASPAFVEKLAALSFEPVGGSPAQFAAHIQREQAKWAEVVKHSGVKMD